MAKCLSVIISLQFSNSFFPLSLSLSANAMCVFFGLYPTNTNGQRIFFRDLLLCAAVVVVSLVAACEWVDECRTLWLSIFSSTFTIAIHALMMMIDKNKIVKYKAIDRRRHRNEYINYESTRKKRVYEEIEIKNLINLMVETETAAHFDAIT